MSCKLVQTFVSEKEFLTCEKMKVTKISMVFCPSSNTKFTKLQVGPSYYSSKAQRSLRCARFRSPQSSRLSLLHRWRRVKWEVH